MSSDEVVEKMKTYLKPGRNSSVSRAYEERSLGRFDIEMIETKERRK